MCSLSSLFLTLPLQGCQVFGQAHGPGHGKEGESHHTVCYRDGQITKLRQNSLWNLQACLWRQGILAPTLHHHYHHHHQVEHEYSVHAIVRVPDWERISRKHFSLRLWLTKSSRCQLSTGDGRGEEESVSFVTSSSSLMQQSATGQGQDLTTEALSSVVVKDKILRHLRLCKSVQKKEREEGERNAKHAALNHPLCASPPSHSLFSFPVFPLRSIIQEEICTRKFADACVTKSGCLQLELRADMNAWGKSSSLWG